MSTKYDLEKFLRDYKVEIPAIQRDYAFGRKEATSKRENFIKILNKAMSKDSIHLDFIYGKEENNKLLLLDGQQRVTTLWLIAVYLAKRTSGSPEWLNNFTYNTRTSSREFCQALIKNDWNPTELDADHKRFSTIWFYNSWKFDPTISGMVSTLQTIDDIFSETPELKLSDLQQITFSFLEIENLGQPEELYLKMNSRGKALTSFENFKANLLEQCKVNNWFEDGKLQVISRKFDTTWTDIFWKNHSKEHEIDDIYLAFLTRFFLNEWIVNGVNPKIPVKEIEKSEEFQSMYSYNEFTDFSVMNKMITKNSIEKLESILDNYSDENISDYLPKYQNAFDYIPTYTKDGISRLTQANRVIFMAISNYLSKSKIEKNSFKRWLRVTSNIVNNASIENNVSMIGALRLINELSDHSQNIMEFLSKNPAIKSSVAEDQLNEEKQKAQRVVLNPNTELSIHEAEDCDFFSGRIRDLIDVDVESGKFDWDTFSLERYLRWNEWTENGNPTNLFRRAFLAYTRGEGNYPNITYGKIGDPWVSLNLGKDNWNAILSDNKDSIRKFIDGYHKNYFNDIINGFEDQNNQYYLIIKDKNESIFNNYIHDERLAIINKELFIRHKSGRALTWSRPETILLFEKLKLAKISSKLTFNRGSAKSDETREGRLHLETESKVILEVKYVDDKYQITVFNEDSNSEYDVVKYWNSRENGKNLESDKDSESKYVYSGSEQEVTDIIRDFAK